VIRPPAKASHTILATLLALALLFAQWAGLAHSVAHAGWQQHAAAASSLAPTDGDSDGGIRHSCAAFDAATLADAVHISSPPALLLTSTQVLAQWLAFVSWDAPLTHYFSSRAPPLA
jgi:hypothetical protein